MPFIFSLFQREKNKQLSKQAVFFLQKPQLLLLIRANLQPMLDKSY